MKEEFNIQQIRFSNGTEVLANIIVWQDDELIDINCSVLFAFLISFI